MTSIQTTLTSSPAITLYVQCDSLASGEETTHARPAPLAAVMRMQLPTSKDTREFMQKLASLPNYASAAAAIRRVTSTRSTSSSGSYEMKKETENGDEQKDSVSVDVFEASVRDSLATSPPTSSPKLRPGTSVPALLLMMVWLPR